MSKPDNKNPHECGAKAKGTGQPCKRKPMANGRCKHHGGVVSPNAGRPPTHGLYASALSTDIGLHTYEASKAKSGQELARDTAEFLIAKVVEAFEGDPENHPNLMVLSRALAPLKGLLEVKQEQERDAAGDLAEALAEAEAQEDAGRESDPMEG